MDEKMTHSEFKRMYLGEWDVSKMIADEDGVRKGVSLGYSTSEIARVLGLSRSEVISIRGRLDI